ncbi:hypothetical protein E2C01_016320 [Portunus trituberculatus]|uniref:Uncharacterized protein n=1 Tax=Portunus trituberculatus TaxID=210409 RepID=A0A5B7DQA7_PORTR|nr:hypothetical protein [Portunus trituberculatus]
MHELQEGREEVIRTREQLRACGGLYQRAMDTLRDKVAETQTGGDGERIGNSGSDNFLQSLYRVRYDSQHHYKHHYYSCRYYCHHLSGYFRHHFGSCHHFC